MGSSILSSSEGEVQFASFVEGRFNDRLEARARLGSHNYGLSTLTGVLSGKVSTGSFLLALGWCGIERRRSWLQGHSR